MGKLDELLKDVAAHHVAQRSEHIALLLRNGASVASIVSALRTDTCADAQTIRQAMRDAGLLAAATEQKPARSRRKRKAAGDAAPPASMGVPAALDDTI